MCGSGSEAWLQGEACRSRSGQWEVAQPAAVEADLSRPVAHVARRRDRDFADMRGPIATNGRRPTLT